MRSSDSIIKVRMAVQSDAGELCALINEIIEIGGTTASEIQLTEDDFKYRFINSDEHIACFVALDETGHPAGFQSLKHNAKLPDGWADIATFARVKQKVPGIGTALFAKSKKHAKQSGFRVINATIRADNVGGLRFYDKIGFETYSVNTGVPLISGVKVDRISKRYNIE